MLGEDNQSKIIEEKINVIIDLLGKEIDFEYAGYKRYREYYNKAARERMQKIR